jgi:hypothetical protein
MQQSVQHVTLRQKPQLAVAPSIGSVPGGGQAAASTPGPYPGPFQAEWDQIYENVKMQCNFNAALDWLESNAARRPCANNRNGGPTVRRPLRPFWRPF